MRAQRPQGAASNPRGHRFGAGVVRVLSVTAVAATACAMMAGAASAASAAPDAPTATTTAITNAVPGVIKVGASFTFDITVTPAAAAGTVTVAGGAGDPTCTATVTAGAATCTVTPPEYGVIDYTATFTPSSATYSGSTSTPPFPLEVQNVTTTTVGPAAGKAGPVTLSAAVYAMGADITDGMGSLTFYNGTKVIKGCAAVLLKTFTKAGDNVGTCPTTLGAGTYTINVQYSGDEVNVASTGTGTLRLTRRASTTRAAASPNPALVHKSVRLSATVKGLGGTARGTVTFTWRGKVICRRSLSGGSMHCSVKFAKAGTYLLTATYAGNSIYKASARQIRVRIKK
jgi:Bacterial Ig-like domain (group 3)